MIAVTRVIATFLFEFTAFVSSGEASSIAFTPSTRRSWFLGKFVAVSVMNGAQHPPVCFRTHQKLLLRGYVPNQPLLLVAIAAPTCGGVAPHRRHSSTDMCVEEHYQNRYCCCQQRRTSSHFNSHILIWVEPGACCSWEERI